MISSERGQNESGCAIPKLGLGTLMIPKGVVENVIKEAVRTGYRLIDCAPSYRNEKGVGQALHDLMENDEVEREELFIVSKIFNTHHVYNGEDRPRESLLQTLEDLQLKQLDLLLMHWPHGFVEKNPPRLRDKKGRPNPNLQIVEEYLETWKSMERLKAEGLVKYIGVSNFKREQIEKLLQAGLSKPIVNQVELHPYLQQPDLVQYCEEQGIQLMAYSPLGSKASQAKNAACPPDIGTTLMENPVILDMAKRHDKSVAQVLIRWSLRRGFACIPRSTKAPRILENFQTYDWELDGQAMHELWSLDRGFRYSTGYVPGHFD